MSAWLPQTVQDRIIRLAKARKQTPSEYLRDALIQVFHAPNLSEYSTK